MKNNQKITHKGILQSLLILTNRTNNQNKYVKIIILPLLVLNKLYFTLHKNIKKTWLRFRTNTYAGIIVASELKYLVKIKME